jgi:hypothetical protein
MAQRPGILTTHFIKAEDGGWPLTQSPNAQPDVITAEVRCHWPYLAPEDQIIKALTEAYAHAVHEVQERFQEKQ